MTKKYKFISDPGHGWIEVPLSELKTLGIADQISEYSYQMGAMVYLEEDDDGSRWFKAMTDAGNPPAFIEVYQDPTPIRNYPRYRGERNIPRATIRPDAFAHLFTNAGA
jgi:hypothetical protein